MSLTNDRSVPKLTVEITIEQRDRMKELIRFGTLKPLLSVMLDALLDTVEQHGEVAIAAILSKDFNLLERIKKENL